jgi:hypothetical protein
VTFHTTSARRQVKGPKCPGRQNGAKSPRIAVSLDRVDFDSLTALAARKKIPVAQVLRDAVWAYLLPFRGTA